MSIKQEDLFEALEQLSALIDDNTGGYMWNTWHTHNKNKKGQEQINNSILEYLKMLTDYVVSKKK